MSAACLESVHDMHDTSLKSVNDMQGISLKSAH